MSSKTIVVSGGSKGIGRAVIEKFMSEGFNAITCARREADLQELQDFLKIKYPQQALFYLQADLSERDEVEHFVDFVRTHTFGVEILVNNTGIFLPGQIHNEEEGTLQAMIQTNLYSAYHLTRGLLGDMMMRHRGHIFNICSTASITAYTNGGSYCISKFALYGMSKVLREELKPHGIRVTSVLPGATLTNSWSGVDLPEDRFMPSEDVAEAIWNAYSLSGRTVIEDLILRPQLGDIN